MRKGYITALNIILYLNIFLYFILAIGCLVSGNIIGLIIFLAFCSFFYFLIKKVKKIPVIIKNPTSDFLKKESYVNNDTQAFDDSPIDTPVPGIPPKLRPTPTRYSNSSYDFDDFDDYDDNGDFKPSKKRLNAFYKSEYPEFDEEDWKDIEVSREELLDFEETQRYYAKKKPKQKRAEKDYLQYTKVRKNESNYTVFDFETTGLSTIKDEIIEIAAIKFVDDKEVDRFHSYVKPVKTRIPLFITQLTQITNEMVSDAPTIDVILPSFLEFIDNENLVAHNAKFDVKFLLRKINQNKLKYQKYRVIDTLPIARRKLYRLNNHKLETIKEYLGLENDSHNALDDCLVTAKLYQELKTIE